MRLYTYSGSANGYKIELALAQLAIPHDRVEVAIFQGEGQTPAFLARNPSGRIPVLELDDGRIVVESNAILWELARGTRLGPVDAATETATISWLCFEQNEIEPVLGSARYWRLTGRDRERGDETARRIAQGARSLGTLDGVLASRRFLVGDRYSIADIAVYAYSHLAGDLGIDLAGLPALQRWLRAVEDQPDFIAGPGPYTADAMV